MDCGWNFRPSSYRDCSVGCTGTLTILRVTTSGILGMAFEVRALIDRGETVAAAAVELACGFGVGSVAAFEDDFEFGTHANYLACTMVDFLP